MNIVITGAARGIGYELVRKLALSGHNILAISRSASILNSFNDPGSGKIIPIVADISSEAGIRTVERAAADHLNTVDALVNNAGTLLNKNFSEITPDEMQYVYNVNVFAAARMVQVIMPLMNNTARSHVVNISSMGGFQGSAKFAGLAMYSSSKAALACLTECLAEEYKEKNIAFNCLALGAAQTEMLNEAFPGYEAPLTAEKMAEFIASFTTTAHQYMNGRIIPVSMSTP